MPTNVAIASGGGAIVVSRDLNNGLPTTTETIPFSAFTSDLIVTLRGGIALVLYRVGTTFVIACNASRSDDRGFGNNLFGSTDPTISNTSLQAAISGSGGSDIATIGDAKSGFQSADHRGWVLLNGRLKTTLTATQQVNATALGIGANLPDATDRGFIQGTLLAQIGSDLIARSNLPNVPITTDAGGNHSHTYLAANGSATQGVGSGSRLAGEISIQQNTPNTGGTGAHTHVVQLNGNVTQTAYTPKSIGVNQFVYLGA
jgi:hypothetical protein